MILLIARHGETKSNNQDLLQGHLHGELSDIGLRQAEALAEYLKDRHIDLIISSDLKRGEDTAKTISAICSIPHVKYKEARERCFGEFEGTNRTAFYKKERSLPFPYKHRPKSGESFEDLYLRAKTFLLKLSKNYIDKTVLLISHGDFTRMCLGVLTGKDVYDACKIKQKNACLNILKINEQFHAESVLLNSIEHLPNDLLSDNTSEL